MEPNRTGERLRRHSHAPSPPMPTKVYSPSIYSYTCRGAYYASSESKVGNEGICKGFQSKLENMYDANQENISRTEALKRFTTMTVDVDLNDYHEASNEFNQQAKTVLLSPALVYKESENKVLADDKDKTFSNRIENDQLPEEELIKRQEWSCYGSTEVEYLVLEDMQTGEKKIAAVAPRNTGISFREIETEDSLRTITRVGLGWLDIIHDNNSVLVDDDTALNSEEEQHAKHQQYTPEEIPPRPATDSIKAAKQLLARTYDFSRHVAEHMKLNLLWLGSNLQDDFPARTYAAGRVIVAQFPKALDSTVETMGKILERWFGSDDDDNND